MANFGFHFVSVIFKCGLGTLALVSSFQKWSWKLKSNHIYPNYGLLKFKNLVFLSTFSKENKDFKLNFLIQIDLKQTFLTQKWPYCHKIMYSCTDHNFSVLLGVFESHFVAIQGKFESIWRPNSKLLIPFWRWFPPSFWPKMAQISPNYVKLHWS